MIPLPVFLVAIRQAVAEPVPDGSRVERIIATLAGHGIERSRVDVRDHFVLCDGLACYCPPPGSRMSQAFREIGMALERMALRGGVLLAKPPMTEYATVWNLRSGDTLPLIVLPAGQTAKP